MKTMTKQNKLLGLVLYAASLKLFAGDLNPNTTTDVGMSDEMKTYYSDYLIDEAQPNLVHDQFGQKHPIPKHGGKTIEFRKYDSLPDVTTQLVEGVTPDGQKLNVTTVEATVGQYGAYVSVSDMLEMTGIDDNIVQATIQNGRQAGRSLDNVTREIINGGTNVQYAEGQVSTRATLYYTSAEDNCNLTVECVRQAMRTLRAMDAEAFEDGNFVAIAHPNALYDIKKDPEWQKPREYVDTEMLYSGEVGMIDGCRFVSTSRAKVFAKAGAGSRDVFSTLFIAKNAYGVTEIEGGGLETIVHQKGSGGTADPLNQRSTVGWKATKVAERLMEPYMVRCETTSTFNA